MNKPNPTYFTKEHADRYDERNSKLFPIANGIHFLLRLILMNLPARARVLSVGAGTGAEILALARVFPDWTFVAVEPSDAMLEVCRARFKEAGILERCELVCGFVQDVPESEKFDAVLSILVAHFVKCEERLDFYGNMVKRLLPDGYFVSAEISFDLDSKEFPSMLEHWNAVQTLMGATPESLAILPQALRDTLAVLPPAEVEALMRTSGVPMPVRFFQSLMISAWYGRALEL